MTPRGQLLEFHSDVDGALHPCVVCATDDSTAPKPLIIEVSPGALNDLPGAVALTEEIAGIAAAHDKACVVLRPTGRGPGSVYQNYGEVDVLEAIEFVASRYPIDRDRITITGASMGGAATWYLASHYPDLFAAAAPFCGYADYRLWEKPGGLTFQMREWEKPSWQARSAALLVENLGQTPVWMVHGEWDRAVGGGVSVEHSRRMARLMGEMGHPFIYTELPGTGHDSRQPDVWERVIIWLLEQRKARNPDHVALATFSLRHRRSYWVAIDQLARYGERALVEAARSRDGRLGVATANVRGLTLGPLPGRSAVSLTIDASALGAVDIRAPRAFRRGPSGAWEAGSPGEPGEKRPGVSGPIGDLFFAGTVLVPGTTGSAAETFFNEWVARDAAVFYRSRNGGVHRGGIMGLNTVDLPVVRDVDLTPEDRRGRNLILYGTAESNAALARYAGSLPLAARAAGIRLAGRDYADEYAAAFAAFPHPENPDRYVAVHGGVTPDAITWGSHLDMGLLPDYLVYARGEVLDWGFWGNDWAPQP